LIRAAICGAALLALSGCAGIPIGVLYGLEAAASAATIADKVIGMDVSLTQSTPGKTPVAAMLAPSPPPVQCPSVP